MAQDSRGILRNFVCQANESYIKQGAYLEFHNHQGPTVVIRRTPEVSKLQYETQFLCAFFAAGIPHILI
jgi:hypothetical protein